MRKVLIATPAYDGRLDVWYVNSLITTIKICKMNDIDLYPIWMSYDALICRARNDLMSIAINENFDDVIWIDSDIEWNPEWVLKLLTYKEDVVGGTYRKKTDENELYVIRTSKIDDNDLIEVDGLGFGFIKMSKEACIDLWNTSIEYVSDGKLSRNVFETIIDNGELIGEDILIGKKLKALGYKIYLDRNMTCNHIGIKKYCGDFNSYIDRIGLK